MWPFRNRSKPQLACTFRWMGCKFTSDTWQDMIDHQHREHGGICHHHREGMKR